MSLNAELFIFCIEIILFFVIIGLISKNHYHIIFKSYSSSIVAKVVDYRIYVTHSRSGRSVYYVPVIEIEGETYTYLYRHMLTIPGAIRYEFRKRSLIGKAKEELKGKLHKELPKFITAYYNPNGSNKFILKNDVEKENYKIYIYVAATVAVLVVIMQIVYCLKSR